MQTGFVLDQVRQATGRLALSSAGVLLAALLLAAGAWPYWESVWWGPWPMDARAVSRLTDVDGLTHWFVTVEGDGMPVDVSETSQGADWRWFLFEVDGRVLVVKSLPAPPSRVYSGILRRSNAPVDELVERCAARDPSLKKRVLPFYLQADAFQPNGVAMTWLVAGVVLLALWNLRNAAVRWRRPQGHPSVRALRRYGALEDVVASIDEEMARRGAPTRVAVTQTWLCCMAAYGFEAWRLDDLVWVYGGGNDIARTGRRPTHLVVHARNGSAAMLVARPAEVEETLDDIACRAPWVLQGYDNETDARWRKDRAGMIAQVAERRAGRA